MAGSISMSRCTTISSRRGWRTASTPSSPTGSRRTPSSTATCWTRRDAWRARTGGRVFAASNQEHHRAAYLRDQAGLGAHFDEIVYSAALGVCKPERVFFTTAQARMHVTAAQSILFVDDKAENVDGARMCGWRAMLYRGPESLAARLGTVGVEAC